MVGLIFGISFAYCQKYAYIDSDYILANVPAYSDAKAKLDKLADRWTKEIEQRYHSLQQENHLLKQKFDDFKKKEIEEKKKEDQFSQKIDELNQETDNLMEEIDKWQM